MDAEPDAAIEALAAAASGSPKAAAATGLVTEISSGREMSLEEFDRALGLHSALEVCLICGAASRRVLLHTCWHGRPPTC